MENQKCDKMILAIIQGDDYQDVITDLNTHGFYATVLESSGGFLRKQSITLMIGLNHERLEDAIAILKRYGQRTVTQFESFLTGNSISPLATSVPVSTRLGGVVLFVLDVDRFERY